MARDFRSSRFRRGSSVGEDVNPSAYIVNLADCMLVLACGFLVALISFYNIDVVPAEQLDESKLEEVEPEEMPAGLIEGGGSYYVEAGKVYRDQNTGILYLVENTGETGGPSGGSSNNASSDSSNMASTGASGGATGGASGGATGGSGGGSSGGAGASGGAGGTSAAVNARANGAD